MPHAPVEAKKGIKKINILHETKRSEMNNTKLKNG
jgi:hypothetical protein